MRLNLISGLVLAGVFVLEGGAELPTAAQAVHLVAKVPPPQPPAPPAAYDPQSGPFIVPIDGRGGIAADGKEIIANAFRNWSGPGLEAFQICFGHNQEKSDWSIEGKAVQAVSRELKGQGAKAVVAPNGLACDSSIPRPNWSGTHVVIFGMVNL